MFPTGFIGVCSSGVRKVIFGGFDKNLNFFFLKKDSGYDSSKKSLKKLFFMGG